MANNIHLLCLCVCLQVVCSQYVFFPQERERRQGLFSHILEGPKRIRDRVHDFLNIHPERPTDPPQTTYFIPFTTNSIYSEPSFGKPVVFPTNPPLNEFNEFGNAGSFTPTQNFGSSSEEDGLIVVEGSSGTSPFNSGSQEGFTVSSKESGEHDHVNFEKTPAPVLSTTSTTTAAPTTLPALTPVPQEPKSESRDSFDFGYQGPFAESCQTVEGGLGSCIVLQKCSQYMSLIQQSRSNPEAVQLLRKAHCGFENTTPKVCCPRPGIPSTPSPADTKPTTKLTTTSSTTPSAPSVKFADEDLVTSLPDPPVCGLSNASFSRVVGGVPAKLGDFPWMALLGYQSKRTGSTDWRCGGALITSRHVLTAAHCIHNYENDLYVVRLGELDYMREDDGATPVDVLIKRKIKHENYDASFTNDIGILVLQNDVQFTDLIRPICLPKNPELRAMNFEKYNPMIAGWGHTQYRGPVASHLQVLQIPVVSNDNCAQAYSAYKKQTIDERVLCAGYKKGGKDACQGDSGGPLMQPIWNQSSLKTYFYQIGVVSYGKKCAEPDFPGVYTRVTHFTPWIEQHVLAQSSR